MNMNAQIQNPTQITFGFTWKDDHPICTSQKLRILACKNIPNKLAKKAILVLTNSTIYNLFPFKFC